MSYARASKLMWEVRDEGSKYCSLIRTGDNHSEGITGPQGRYVTFSTRSLETLTLNRPHDYVAKYTGSLPDDYVMEKSLRWLLQGIF